MGINAYTVYTQAAVDALGIADLCGRMSIHVETYEHLGQVTVHVQDMHTVWERERVRHRVFVQPSEAVMSMEHDFPVGPALLWDYLTKPEYRSIVLGSDTEKVTGRSDGRTGPGTTYYCSHGLATSKHSIVDWQPFEQITYEDTDFLGTTNLFTIQLEPNGGGTRVTYLCGRSRGRPVVRQLNDVLMHLIAPYSFKRGLQNLHDRIDEEIAQGKVVQAAPVAVQAEAAAEKVAP